MTGIEERYEASDANAARASGLAHHPLVVRVFKTALAAGVAYAAGNALPGPLDQYAYYAPLGAVTVIYPAVADSVLQGAKAVAAVLVGVGLAVLTMFIAWPDAVSVALVIGVGTAIAAVGWFGEQRSWVPLAALFVLTASEPETEGYVIGYVTQLPLGAAIGLLTNVLLFPQMSLHDLDNVVHALRLRIVEQLKQMALVLQEGGELDRARWRESLQSLDEPRREMRDMWNQALRSQRGNIRSRRWSGVQHDLLELAQALERCSFLIEDVGLTLTEFETGDSPIFMHELRDGAAETLDALADVLAHPHEATPDSPRTRHAQEAVDRLMRQLEEVEFTDARRRILASEVAVSAGRVLHTYVRRHGIEEVEERERKREQENREQEQREQESEDADQEQRDAADADEQRETQGADAQRESGRSG
ncbi:MAG TPA: hypothetical protein VFJ12_05900 [Segeticoccus sp.]|nr:hypothetical protein [Segeticoccus sp.]